MSRVGETARDPARELQERALRLAERGEPILSVDGLVTEFRTGAGLARAVDGLSFDLYHGETLAIVGESGSGKSVTALSILRLIEHPGRIVSGAVRFAGEDLLHLEDRAIQRVRGDAISMIFQEPMTSLNPVLSIGRQLTEALVEHRGIDEREAARRAVEMLRKVRLPEPESRLRQYPHQLSGGMRQRIMIAMALACEPEVLIADEPTTALDVTIQAQILDLMRDLKAELGSAIILITHDMGVVAEMADRVIVMYAGRKVEEGSVEAIFESPRHPYTKGLLGALPRLGEASRGRPRERLVDIPGFVPSLTNLPEGCRFASRCSLRTGRCQESYPPFERKAEGQWAACFHSEQVS
jgi:peptide/nickel transport system ATP-binding protein